MFSKSMSEPIDNGSKLDQAKKHDGESVVMRADAAIAFDATEEVFDLCQQR